MMNDMNDNNRQTSVAENNGQSNMTNSCTSVDKPLDSINAAAQAPVWNELGSLSSQEQLLWEQRMPAANASQHEYETENPPLNSATFPNRYQDAISIFDTAITNIDEPAAIELIEKILKTKDEPARVINFVNAHTLNTACDDTHYQRVLNQSFRIFGDGTGVRWGAKAQGIKMRANLNGTDLMPLLFEQTANRGYTYFILGADEESNERAAEYARKKFPGWDLVGYHHGFVQGEKAQPVINIINRRRPHLLLVGMGNPLQERWIHAHLDHLNVRLAMGVGGLFDHWAGNLRRAPKWVRYFGCEWLQLLLQQPHKARRYLVGNPKFLFRILKHLGHDRAQTKIWQALDLLKETH